MLITGLLLAVQHVHLGPDPVCHFAACIHCGGGAAIDQPTPELVRPVFAEGEEREPRLEPPALRYQRRLDQSGGAPPPPAETPAPPRR